METLRTIGLFIYDNEPNRWNLDQFPNGFDV